MSTPRRHHFVPELLLSRWEDAEGRIPFFMWGSDGLLKAGTVLARETAFESHLYSFERVAELDRHKIETEFFAKNIEHHAAIILDKMLRDGIGGLTPEERVRWAAFLIACRARVPEIVHEMRAQGPLHVENALRNAPEYEALKGDAKEPNLLEWTKNHRPDRIANFGISMLPRLITWPETVEKIARLSWSLFDLTKASCEVLCCDRPLVAINGLEHPQYTTLLPVGPRHLFIATASRAVIESLDRAGINAVVRRANESLVGQARRWVYGRAKETFVKKHLQRHHALANSGAGRS